VYLLGKRINGGLTGLTAAACYGFLSTNISVLGFATHVSHFVVLFTVGGLLTFLRAQQKGGGFGSYLLAGVLGGAAVAVKQAALFLILVPVVSMMYAWFTAKPKPPLRNLTVSLGGF